MSALPTHLAEARGRPDRIYVATLGAGVLLPTVLSLWFPPRLGNDAATLMLSWNHLVRTGAACSLPALDPANIAADGSVPLSWWSPGPIWLIGTLARCGLNFGQATTLCLGLAGWLQLAGWRRLYRQLGFSPAIAAWSLILMAGSWHTLYSFRNFLGGDIFAAALLPWIALLLLATSGASFAKVLGSFTPALLLAVFFKLSFLVTAAGLAAGAWIAVFAPEPRRDYRRALLHGLALGAALAVAWAITHHLLLDRGGSPADPALVTFDAAETVRRGLLPLVLPFASLVAFTSFGAKLCDALGIAHLSANTGLVALAAVIALVLHVALWRRAPSRRARGFVASLSAVYFIGFAALYLRGAAVSFEDRLFAPCGWFLLPGLLALAWKTRNAAGRAAGLAFVALALGWGVGSYVFRVSELARSANFSARGYSLTTLPAAMEREVRQADQDLPGDDTLFASPSLECLLAVERHRVAKLTAHDREFRGRLRGSLVVVLPPELDLAGQLARFADYPHSAWQVRTVARWNICVATDSRPPSPSSETL